MIVSKVELIKEFSIMQELGIKPNGSLSNNLFKFSGSRLF